MAKVIRAIKPNAGIRAKYRKRLVSLLDEMQRSVVWWLRAEYRKQETRIAQDASPASDLQDRLKSLFRYWTKRWRESAESFAREFACDDDLGARQPPGILRVRGGARKPGCGRR